MADKQQTHIITEDSRTNQFMLWALPSFEIMLDQAVKAMGNDLGTSIMMFAHCYAAAGLAINSREADPKAAFLEQCEFGYDAALKKVAHGAKEEGIKNG